MLFAAICYVFAAIALVATGVPEYNTGETWVAVCVFGAIGAGLHLWARRTAPRP